MIVRHPVKKLLAYLEKLDIEALLGDLLLFDSNALVTEASN